LIDGLRYEDELTSGGAADLPDALEGKVRSLDYKTLRHPGHYAWVDSLISDLGSSTELITLLQTKMGKIVPHVEDDQIILYAAVEGYDHRGILKRREVSKRILPQIVGKDTLRAIQTTTAVTLIQAAMYLLESKAKGIILQSQLDPHTFLNGAFVQKVYGEV
jgi:saccharopine dehydrogenase-like NADP-dependent oxidoreductase